MQKAATLTEKAAFEGPNVVKKFDTAELKALLTHHNTQDKPKGNKGELLKRDLKLPSIKQAEQT